jgi:hypothetical protein
LKPLVRKENTRLKIVAELIDTATGKWKDDLVKDIFCPLDAEAILGLPRPRGGGDDFWAWNEKIQACILFSQPVGY